MKHRLIIIIAVCLLHLTAGISFSNYLSNGDFESGNTSIFSDYNYISSPPLLGVNEYVITDNPNNNHPDAVNISGASGSGSMMMIRAGGNNVVTAWTQTITGLGTEDYAFQVLYANIWDPWAHIKVYANGQEVSSCGNILTGQWLSCTSHNLQADASGELTIDIISGYGSDTYMFAMDDLILAEELPPPPPVVPEPISSVLFLTGGSLLAGKRLVRK